jgi:hypothetical protein
MRLHINIDHVATVRQARRTDEPDPVRVAVLAELGGAAGITVHLREDRRHVQERDVRLLQETVRTGLNLELAAAGDVVEVALELRPMAATFVPEKREEITTEGGLDLADTGARARVAAAVERLRRSRPGAPPPGLAWRPSNCTPGSSPRRGGPRPRRGRTTRCWPSSRGCAGRRPWPVRRDWTSMQDTG